MVRAILVRNNYSHAFTVCNSIQRHVQPDVITVRIQDEVIFRIGIKYIISETNLHNAVSIKENLRLARERTWLKQKVII